MPLDNESGLKPTEMVHSFVVRNYWESMSQRMLSQRYTTDTSDPRNALALRDALQCLAAALAIFHKKDVKPYNPMSIFNIAGSSAADFTDKVKVDSQEINLKECLLRARASSSPLVQMTVDALKVVIGSIEEGFDAELLAFSMMKTIQNPPTSIVFSDYLTNIPHTIHSIMPVSTVLNMKQDREGNTIISIPENDDVQSAGVILDKFFSNLRNITTLRSKLKEHPNLVIPSAVEDRRFDVKIEVSSDAGVPIEPHTFMNQPVFLNYGAVQSFLPFKSGSDPLMDTFRCVLDLVRAVAHLHRNHVVLETIHPNMLVRTNDAFGLMLSPHAFRMPELVNDCLPENENAKTLAANVWELGATIKQLQRLLFEQKEALAITDAQIKTLNDNLEPIVTLCMNIDSLKRFTAQHLEMLLNSALTIGVFKQSLKSASAEKTCATKPDKMLTFLQDMNRATRVTYSQQRSISLLQLTLDTMVLSKLGRIGDISRTELVNLSLKDDFDQIVAMKTMRHTTVVSDSVFFVETREKLLALNHPNIVKYLDVGIKNRSLHLLMETANGGSLDQWMEKFARALDPERALNFARAVGEQIFKGLQYLHENNMIHGNLKPENILLTDDGLVLLTDVALVRSLDLNVTLAPSTSEKNKDILAAGRIIFSLAFCLPWDRPDFDWIYDELLDFRQTHDDKANAFLDTILYKTPMPTSDYVSNEFFSASPVGESSLFIKNILIPKLLCRGPVSSSSVEWKVEKRLADNVEVVTFGEEITKRFKLPCEQGVVKTMLMSKTEEENFSLRRAVTILDKSQHPNIVRLLAATRQEQGVHVITELADLGSLDFVLQNNRLIDSDLEQLLLGVACQVLMGLLFLHEKLGYAHKVLTADNILLTSDGYVKLCGFASTHKERIPEAMSIIADLKRFGETLRQLCADKQGCNLIRQLAEDLVQNSSQAITFFLDKDLFKNLYQKQVIVHKDRFNKTYQCTYLSETQTMESPIEEMKQWKLDDDNKDQSLVKSHRARRSLHMYVAREREKGAVAAVQHVLLMNSILTVLTEPPIVDENDIRIIYR